MISNLPTEKLLTLAVIFFATSVVSVVTGSTSLLTVPVMIQVGIEPHVAVATNMFALIFLSAGGLAPLWRSGNLSRLYLPASTVLTVVGSVAGALLLTKANARFLQLVIVAAMIAAAALSFRGRNTEEVIPREPSRIETMLGYAFTLVLGVYGGFFSGGYVTLLTAVFVTFLHMTLLQSVASTKLMNLISSFVATSLFAWRGLVDVKLGLLLGTLMFAGGLLGGRIALKLSPRWLRLLFMAALIILALRILVSFA